jgi:hypothetical protein
MLSLKRGSVQPECILGGLRFRSTAIRFFKFVWYFKHQVLHTSKFFLKKRLELKSLGWLDPERRVHFSGYWMQGVSTFKDFVFHTMWFQKRMYRYFRVLLGPETSP